MDDQNLEIDSVPSPHDPIAGAHVGVRIRHKILSLVAESTSKKTQFANKLMAIEMLKIQQVKGAFSRN